MSLKSHYASKTQRVNAALFYSQKALIFYSWE